MTGKVLTSQCEEGFCWPLVLLCSWFRTVVSTESSPAWSLGSQGGFGIEKGRLKGSVGLFSACMNWLCSKRATGCGLCVSTAIKYLEKLEVLWVTSEGLYLTLMVFRIQMPQKIPQTIQTFISLNAENHTIRRIVTLNLPVNQRVRSDRFRARCCSIITGKCCRSYSLLLTSGWFNPASISLW